MNKKWIFFVLSAVVILPGIISLIKYGFNLGIDFTGGTTLEYKFESPTDQSKIKTVFENSKAEVSVIEESNGKVYTIKSKPLSDSQISEIQGRLTAEVGKLEVTRVESVGPVIGSETSKNAVIALLLASVAIIIYISLAFYKVPKPASSWRFGMTAVIALLHDVLLLVGIFSILGHFLDVEMDVLFITALLTVIGFSVHDTIVVFDRIRENLPRNLSKSFTEVANLSIVQTLARSLNTSLTVVFVLLALLLFGGEAIRWFLVALLIGIISGTYSSIFNATALLVLWEEKLGH